MAQHNIERWRAVLSEAECAQAARFRMQADVNRFTVTRGVLRSLLGAYLQVPPDTIKFTESANGKPAIDRTLQFNVSHSGDYALLAFAENIDVGVDIERITDERVVNDLARRVLSDAEYARFDLLAESDRTRTFFEIWTLKESVLKGMGSGLSIAPESIEVEKMSEWTVRSLSIGRDDYAAAVAVKQKDPVIELKWFE